MDPRTPLPPPLALRLSGPGAEVARWRALASASGLPLAEAGDDAHDVLLGTPQQLVPLLQARLAASTGAAAGPVTALAELPDPEVLAALSLAGLSGWWGPAQAASPQALAACLRADQARWQRERALHEALQAARTQLDERRWVDRAKGVLMQSRGLSEEEAFRLLRGAAMSGGLRVGEVSRSVTEAAQWAEAVNRAGQLRMLSQRVVQLGAQRLAGIGPRAARQAQGMAIGRLQDNLDFLAGLPAMRDEAGAPRQALAAVEQAWRALKPVLLQRLGPTSLALGDTLAEQLLASAEALTEALEAGGARRALRLVNLCGRQRMRVQRLAKQALLAVLLQQPERQGSLPALMDDVEATLLELERAPLGSPAARATLVAAREQWLHLLRGLRGAHGAEGRQAMAVASEALLVLFDGLTADYEHSLQLVLS